MDKTLNRTVKPDASGEIKFRIPQIERFRLNNNLSVLFVRKENLPILTLNLITESGSKFDPYSQKGLANLFARVLDEGAGKYDAIGLSDEFDNLGSNFNISCFNDNIHITLQTLKENLDRSLEIFGTILSQPYLDEKSSEREKRKVLTFIQQLKDSPEDIADIAFDRVVFGEKNPYAYPLIGYEEDVNNISVQDIKDYYKQKFSPGTSTLIVVGNSSQTELEKKLNNYFAGWDHTLRVNNVQYPLRAENFSIYFIHKEGAVQSEIRVGHLSGKRNDIDFFAKHLLNLILGGQFSSRINLNLREDKGYTYGAASRFNYLKDSAQFLLSTSVSSENTGRAINEILKELKEIRNGVKDKELEFAKSSVIRRYPGNFETYNQVAANLVSLALHSLPDNYFDTYIDSVDKLNIDEVNKAAVENIHPDKLSVLVVGDKNLILKQLEELNSGNVTELDIWGKKV